jgi:hypothetical protein
MEMPENRGRRIERSSQDGLFFFLKVEQSQRNLSLKMESCASLSSYLNHFLHLRVKCARFGGSQHLLSSTTALFQTEDILTVDLIHPCSLFSICSTTMFPLIGCS